MSYTGSFIDEIKGFLNRSFLFIGKKERRGGIIVGVLVFWVGLVILAFTHSFTYIYTESGDLWRSFLRFLFDS